MSAADPSAAPAAAADPDGPDAVRLTWNAWPLSKVEASRCVVPLAATVSPARAPDPSVPAPPPLPYPPLRCKPPCSALLNPFSRVDFAAKIWICPLCFSRNHFPPHYAAISESNVPAELFPQCSTVEYLVGGAGVPGAPGAPAPPPPVFLFVIDTCVIEEELEYVKMAMRKAVALLPEHALVGLVTFGTQVHLHELGFSDLSKIYVFRGTKEISKEQILDQLGLAGARRPGFPKMPQQPGGPQVNGMHPPATAGVNRFLLPVSECECALSTLLDELQSDQWPVEAGNRAIRCTGVALSVAAGLLGACMPGTGARIIALLGGPCTEGPGMIVSKDLSEPVRSHKDLDKDAAPHFQKAVKFYDGLAKQLVSQGHVLDVFASALDQVGLAEMKVAIERTGGLVVLSESFGHSVFKDSFKRIFEGGEQSLGLSFNGTLEINCSKDIKVQGIIGPCTSLEKKGALCADTVVGQGNTTAWKMCGLDRNTSLTVFFDVSPSERSSQPGHQNPHLYIQFVTSYQHPEGQMRIRVTTICRKWVDGSTNTEELVEGFDQETADPERNYHCFYMLCSAPPEDVKRFKVGDPRSFHYLNQTNCYEVANVDDAREYLETRNAMNIVGIDQEEQDAIFRVVAAILHLGNIDFSKGQEIDSSKLRDDKSVYHLKIVAELLMCDEKALEDSLCQRVIVTPDGNITKPLDPDSAALSRDALAKTVYSRLFDWIVDKINNSIGQDPDATNIIGVLDIYGFESFKINSFEQLCINLTNEKLQQHFNQHVFKMEQEEYTREEIDWSYVEFVDNQDVLDLIEKKPGGIIALLDEACMFPKSTHETFAQKMYQTYKTHKRFSKPKLARTAFTINHYAGDVTYQADQFLDKNKDYVVAEHQALLNSSRCPFVANLFPPLPEETSKQSKFSSIGTRFKQQLQSLMETLSTTEPHYIRCVKPNAVLKPGIFENFNVLNQLRCGGVLEAIRISCAGYPTKRTFDEFMDRFGMLAPELVDSSDEKAACAAICDRMSLTGYQIGKTKVFLRAGQMAELDARRTEVLANAARLVQRRIKTHLMRKEFINLRKAAVQSQKFWRARLARKLFEYMRRDAASIRIQKHARTHSARKAYLQVYESAVVLQTGLRAMAARNEHRFRRETKAAIIIQTRWRQHKAYIAYKQHKRASLILQCLWRARIARKELRKLRMEARETGALKEAKDKLEKRVEELTWRLDVEKRMRIDLEEAKGQEITKLQSALQQMQENLEEAHAAIVKEKELAKLAIEQAPPKIVEVPVVDNAKVEELTNQNKELEDELSTFKRKAEDLEKRLLELQKQSDELSQETQERESKVNQLQEMMERLETSLSNMESENQVLRQQSLVASAEEDKSKQIERLESKIAILESEIQLLRSNSTQTVQDIVTPEMNQTSVMEVNFLKEVNQTSVMEGLDNGHQLEEVKIVDDQVVAPPVKNLSKQKSLTDRQQENHDALIKSLAEDRRFDDRKSAAACIVYKSLLHWHSFEAERTNIFDRIILTIRSSVEGAESSGDLAYWLSTTSTLLCLLQNTLKASSSTSKGSNRSRTTTGSLFSRMVQNARTSSSGLGTASGYSGMVGRPDTASMVEAKYPALRFKQQLTAYVEKIYGTIRDNLKKEISPFLTMCIQAPRAIRVRPSRGSLKSIHSNALSRQASIVHWQSIVKCLDHTLDTMNNNYVPPMIIRKTFSQVFAFLNVQLFNSLLLRRECCSFSNGEFLKAGLQELEQWCSRTTEEYAGTSWDELQNIRQAVGFLVFHQKSHKTLEEITNKLCPVLSITQIYRIATMFWDDKYGAQGLSQEVIGKMRTMTTDDSITTPNSSFLLDDDSSIPISLDDIARLMPDVDPSNVEPPPLLRQNSQFHFLLQQHTD